MVKTAAEARHFSCSCAYLHYIFTGMNNLKIQELRTELENRGLSTGRKAKHEVKEKVDAILRCVETLRGSDYRKRAIVMFNTLQNLMSIYFFTLATAVEMTELLYCDPTQRTSQSVLRLCNMAFQIMLISLIIRRLCQHDECSVAISIHLQLMPLS